MLHSLALSVGGVWTAEAYAEALVLTPRATEGPYYPDHLPLDQDNDLLQISGQEVKALGTEASFGGRLLDANGKAIRDATIELWQADNNGCYLHSQGVQRGKERDPHFQGFGKVATNAKGEYRFRTIVPGLYTGRTRHWHIAVVKDGKRLLTTQLFLAGEPQNDRDGILQRMGNGDVAQRLSVIRDFKPEPSLGGALVAAWDIVIGGTPEDPERRGPPPRGERRGPPPGPPPER